MNTLETPELILEPERYEMYAALPYRFNVDRREFFKTLGCGMVVLFLVDTLLAQESGSAGRRGGGGFNQAPVEISAWLHIGEDGTVNAFTGKAEVGQNIRTSLAQAVAEELRIPISSVKMVMADTQLVPWDAGTFGSLSTPQMASRLHKIGAQARESLLALAADYFKTDVASLTLADGKISKTGDTESVTFGQLTKGQNLVKAVDDHSAVTPATDWKIAGTSVPKVNGRDFVTGKHKYASDLKSPGMVYGKVLRPVAFNATLVSLDSKAAEAMPGVVVVHDGNFVGVTAPDALTANHAVDSLRAEWTFPEAPSSTEIYDYLKANVVTNQRQGFGGGGNRTTGSMEDGLAAADIKLQQTYKIAYIAHAPLEPRAALAEWKDDKLTVITGSQRPFGVRSDVAKALGISDDNVRIIVPDTGSGYGGKHTAESAIEAARLAKSAGKPVKLVWTRQEEFTWAYFRPAGVIDISSGVKKDGTLTAWEFHNYNSGNSAIGTHYEVPNQKIEFHATKYPLQQGSYRGLAGTANIFARETHMDELAAAVKMNPLEFRLKNLKNDRVRAVLEAATKAFGWSDFKPADGHGIGLACGTEKGSCIAACAEVAVDKTGGSVKIIRVVAAFECGAVVNPDQLKNLIEGCQVMGLGGALFESIEFKNGMVTNPHFADYRVPRFGDLPKIEVVLVDRKDIASAGAGETPIMAIAPAVGNAIFNAAGTRLRELPMVPDGLKV